MGQGEDLNLTETKQFMIETAREAGKIAMKSFRRPHECSTKDDYSYQIVCESDVACEKLIKDRIKKNFPGHAILAEESADSGDDKKKSEYLWVIDPIDGTRNFVQGHPVFGISIALARDREVILGVVYFPALGWLFSAEKGKGAEMNRKKISVSDRNIGNDTFACFGCNFHQEKENQLKTLSRYIDMIKKVRIEGATTFACCMVASGTYDCYIQRFNKPWDYAASCLIVEEAGGKVTDYNGNKWGIDMSDFAVSNGKFHDRLIKTISGGK